jgi:hypothetical protein
MNIGTGQRSLLAALLSVPLACQADRFAGLDLIESAPTQEVWLTSGFITHHFQQDKNLNGNNPGWGLEYRYTATQSVTLGEFFNSDRQTARYLGIGWQPLAVGPVRIGLFAGALDGYPKMENGNWFLAAIPLISMEYGRFGANFTIIPTYRDRLYGGIAMQLRCRLY